MSHISKLLLIFSSLCNGERRKEQCRQHTDPSSGDHGITIYQPPSPRFPESRVFGNFVTGASAGRPILFEEPERILTRRHAFGVIVPLPVGAHTQFVFYLPEKIVWKPLRSVLLD